MIMAQNSVEKVVQRLLPGVPMTIARLHIISTMSMMLERRY